MKCQQDRVELVTRPGQWCGHESDLPVKFENGDVIFEGFCVVALVGNHLFQRVRRVEGLPFLLKIVLSKFDRDLLNAEPAKNKTIFIP